MPALLTAEYRPCFRRMRTSRRSSQPGPQDRTWAESRRDRLPHLHPQANKFSAALPVDVRPPRFRHDSILQAAGFRATRTPSTQVTRSSENSTTYRRPSAPLREEADGQILLRRVRRKTPARVRAGGVGVVGSPPRKTPTARPPRRDRHLKVFAHLEALLPGRVAIGLARSARGTLGRQLAGSPWSGSGSHPPQHQAGIAVRRLRPGDLRELIHVVNGRARPKG